MNSFILFLVQLSFRFLPDTKCFRYKRIALRFAGAKIGHNVRICSSVRIIGDSQITIADNTWIGHGTWIFCSAPILIGNNVNIGPLVYIGTGTHLIEANGPSVAGSGISEGINIGDGAWLCARAMVLPGVTLGSKSVLAAGAVAINDIPANCIAGGIPAKFIKSIYD